MCGRYALHAQPEVIALEFGLSEVPAVAPRYNVAPGTPILVVLGEPRRAAEWVWGLVPPWVRDLGQGKGIINARGESVRERAPFRDAFRRQRCLVPASGYFEWKTAAGGRQSYYIHPASDPLFGFAGLFTLHRNAEGKLGTCAIITTQANAAVREVHDRMPAMLRREDYGRWLDPATPPGEALALLGAPAPGDMSVQRVSPRVNAVRNDDPACIAPLA